VRYTKNVKFLNKNLFTFCAIILLAFFLRFYNYTSFPIGGETADESAWTYLGSSLIQEGQPTSWSYFRPYLDNYIYQQRGDEAPLVRPALDHPPLFALIPGIAHTVKNNWQTHPSIKLIRLPMILIGTLNVAIIFLLSSKYFKKKKWVYLTSLIYATAPSFVFASRLVVAENLLVTWTLLALILLRPDKWKFKYIALLLVGVLAVLTKVSGIIIPIAIFVYGLSIKDKKTISVGLWGLIAGIILFSLYGAFFNWGLFIDVLFGQSNRPIGWMTLYNRFFLHPGVIEKIFFDGWVMLGLFASAISLYKNKKTFLALNIFIILNLLFILATSGENTYHGWYDYMLYPLFVVVIVDNLKRVFKKYNYLMFGFFWLLILPLFSVAAVHSNLYHEVPSLMMRGVMGLGFIPYGLNLLGFKIDNEKLKVLMWSLLLILILVNIYVVIVFDHTRYWEMDAGFRTQWCADLI
jgi:4-amino-4-deoxy-L-arabinose transferase-like glycosyltransferase